MYAILGLAGTRFGEAAALRRRHYDPTLEPLGRLVIAASYNTDLRKEKSTKTEQPRLVPVRPTLAKILAAWKLGGWPLLMGRKPVADDLRRTFISLARGDGARKDILETVTHGACGDIIDAYTTLPWPSVCEEAAKLKVELIQGKVIEMPRLAVVGADRRLRRPRRG